MPDLKAQFDAAVAASKTLPAQPGNEILLRMYALYKQATDGDVATKRPGFTDPVGRAKWDARDKIKGMSTDDAMAKYAELVDSLK